MLRKVPNLTCSIRQLKLYYIYSAEQHCADMKEHGVVKKLVALLDKDKTVCSYALLCLAAMTSKSNSIEPVDDNY